MDTHEGATAPVSLAGDTALADFPSRPSPDGKKILLAAPRGYCAGVDRAVDAVEKALELYGAPVYVRKEIVHNRFVVDTLATRGAIFVDDTSDVPEGARIVFSAHGVSPAVRAQAEERGLLPIDATCPLVAKVHRQALRFAGDELDILLIGHAGHEEVEGTQGEAPDRIRIVGGPEDVARVEARNPERVAWISQTTLSVDETLRTVELLRERFPNLIDPPTGDICYATQNRQGAVKEMAGRCDAVIVVGSANSSNTVRLAEVALDAGAPAAYRIDKAEEIDTAWLEGVTNIGVTSGASVPDILVRETVARLCELGYTEIETVATVKENLSFALPKNLRDDLKAAGRA